jgi:RNA polymerase sigma factor (sigma-70 family)
LSQDTVHIEQLLQDCREGKHYAQLEIYNRYYKAMYNTALRIVKDPAEAEDIMQESFLKAFTKLSSFKKGVAFGAWLKKIVVNTSIYYYRKQKRKEGISLEDILYKVEDIPETETDEEFAHLKAQQVWETMKQLKDSYRVSLTLHLIEGYDYDELPNMLGISYGSCRTLISRAKESLRKKLSEACI